MGEISREDDKKGDDQTAGWAKEGDQAFKLTGGKTPFEGDAETLSNNCDEKKDELRRRFQVTKFGSCSHPTPVDADIEAAKLILEVLAAGAVINTEFGHKTVKNRVGPITFNTYLAYAGGDRP
ncbi:MAG: hypothetical protein K2V38_26995 [Gemmataceae bacterium]|nr:hypothetical protein [Gemmataceae bacterium]